MGKRWQPFLGKPTAAAAGNTQTEGAIERNESRQAVPHSSDEHTLGLSKELLIVRRLDPLRGRVSSLVRFAAMRAMPRFAAQPSTD
jgi:hypothetical protein